MTDFQPRNEHELDALSDEQLLAHLIAARAAGDPDQVRLALQILVFGHLQRVQSWVTRRIPTADIEDVTATVIESAVRSAASAGAGFDGTQVGQFRAWLHQITKFRIADYFRSREGKPDQVPLPDEHDGEEGLFSKVDGHPDHADQVADQDLIERALGELSDDHQLVIRVAGPVEMGFDGIPAKQAAAQVNDQLRRKENDSMTDANVHKILSRFRERCRALYEEAETGV